MRYIPERKEYVLARKLFMQWAQLSRPPDEKLPEQGKQRLMSIGRENRANKIVHGDAATVLGQLPDESVHCIVTSPPYYLQRDYSNPTQIGNEPTPTQYIEALRLVFRESKRILRTDGILWLNLGDKYQSGDLLGMPWRVALALKEDGWMLRSDVIWHKPNAMPSSVKSRPTTDHEYVFVSHI